MLNGTLKSTEGNITEIPFSEDRYYSEYKKIRNKFRKYNSLSILQKCVEYLHHPTKDKFENLAKHPWFVMLLMKWVLIDDKFSIHRKRQIDNKATYDLIQGVFDLSTFARLPNDFDHHTLFMRGMAYQQFMYQEDFSFPHFARQQILFSELAANNYIQRTFTRIVGLDIKRFLELCLILMTRFITTNEKKISRKWFSSLGHEYSDDEVDKCLYALSLPIMHVRKRLRDNDSGKRLSEEFYEQTPFVRYPLIRNQNDFICIHNNILFRCIEHFVYDLLKEIDSEDFMQKFGKMFEQYIGKIINYTDIIYISEDEIKKCAQVPKKAVDYIIIENNANIFIDAKAVEMAYKGKVAYSSNIIKDKVKVSVLKAIEQAHDTINQIHTKNLYNENLVAKENNYLIVITCKEFYLSKGLSFYNNIAKDKIDTIYSNNVESGTIPPENMFFVTIQEFELLMEYVRSKKIKISDCFERVKKDDADPQTSKFVFTQHLLGWKANDPPSFLVEKANDTLSKFQRLLT